jgi:hypothetical protein
MKAAIRFIKEQGGKIVHVYPTHVLIGYVPRELRAKLIGQMGIQDVTYDVEQPEKVSKHGRSAEAAVEAWNNNFKGRAKQAGLEPPAGFSDPPPIDRDLLTSPNNTGKPSRGGGTSVLSSRVLQTPLQAPGYYDTSEYFMGEVAVGIILPESTGGQENWSTARQNNVVSEVQAAMNWWAAPDSNTRLTFVYDISLSVPTTYEPIALPQSSEGSWIGQVMANLGFSSGDYFERVYSYLNNRRSSLGTDWAFAVFVVDSLNDADGYFSDGYFAYAYLGGPFTVMTYDNDNYYISNMDAVTAHETGHIFYALDQYYSAGYSCTASSGYLNVQNQNSEYHPSGPCLSNVASIMRGQVSPYTTGAVDTYARQQLGWRDSDGDTVMDILDFEPNTLLNAYSPDPTTDATPAYTGSAVASTNVYPNGNPWSWGNSITINKIATVQYRINSGSWISANSSDGAFDSTSEEYTFTTASLADGTYTFEARAVHTAGAADSSPASDVLTIITRYQLTITASPPGTGSTSPALGSYWHNVGASVSVSATPASGYSFYHWSLDGVNVGNNPSYSIVMDSDHSLTAFFRGSSSISLLLSPSAAPLGGAVTLSGSMTPAQPSPGIPAGTVVVLSYSLDSGATWNTFMTTQTDGSGGYSTTWYPPYPNTCQLKATWSGNANYVGATSPSVSLTVTGTPSPFVILLASGPPSVTRGGEVVFEVLVTNPGSSLSGTLYIEVVGPGGYDYFETVQVSVAAGSAGSFQFRWQAPSVTGTYQVTVGFVPPRLSTIGQTQIAVA